MARIPESEVERLKRHVSLVRLLESQGHVLVRQGKDWALRCPWHEGDETPSCVITEKTNLWHCFGCDAGGTVIDWVMRSNRVSFRHACELLRKDHPALTASPEEVGLPTNKKTWYTKRPGADLSASDEDQAVLDQVIDYYHSTLTQSPEALAYLTKRGLDSLELIERFRLGYANRTLGYRLPQGTTRSGAAVRGQLQRIGLLRESGHEHFAGSLVVPVFSFAMEGTTPHVVGVYGRKIIDNLRAGTPKHLYLPGAHRGVWNVEGLIGQAEVILCEALIDAFTFWQAGYRNVTASYGVNGFTDEHLSTFQQSGIQRVLIAYDRDEAGDRAAELLATQLNEKGLACYRLVFPKGHDANSYALAVQPARQSLGVVIRSAVPLGDLSLAALPRTSLRGEEHDEAIINRKTSSEPVVNGDLAGITGASPVELSAAVERTGVGGDVSAGTAGHGDSRQYRLAAKTTATGSSGEGKPGVALEGVGAGRESVAAPVEASPALIPLPAAAVPPLPEADVPVDANERQLAVAFGERRYRVRGHTKTTSFEVMKINVLVSIGEALHVDTLDLYAAKQRTAFARAAAAELECDESVIQHDLGKLLLKLEQLQDARLEALLKPKTPTLPVMSEAEHAEALVLLQAPDLAERIIADVARTGLVGEPTNALVAYLATLSRKLSAPLAILIQSTSAAGKSALMDAVLALVPDEDRVQYSAMTGQSLFYLGEKNLKHKILAIAEEEGVRQAAYALKLLQSQGQLTMASTGKDPQSGMLVTQEYRVEGPVMLFLTTTAIDIDEELLNRCLVLTINESREQTRAIQQKQRYTRTLAGLMAQQEATDLMRLHRNAQRLLRPLAVVNPYAEQLTFLDERTRTRRDHQKYLTLIDAIALLHQYQRPVRTLNRGIHAVDYIEVEVADIALANRLAHEVLGRSLDELPPQTRRVLGVLDAEVGEQASREALARRDVRFTRREVRQWAGLSDTQARVHLERLLQLEYVIAHAGKNGQRFVYELAFDGEVHSDVVQCAGLIDVATLREEIPDLAGGARGTDGLPAVTVRSETIPLDAPSDIGLSSFVPSTAATALITTPLLA